MKQAISISSVSDHDLLTALYQCSLHGLNWRSQVQYMWSVALEIKVERVVAGSRPDVIVSSTYLPVTVLPNGYGE